MRRHLALRGATLLAPSVAKTSRRHLPAASAAASAAPEATGSSAASSSALHSSIDEDDDFFTPSVADQYEDLTRPAVGPALDGLSLSIDSLLEDLYNCNNAALRQFARQKGVPMASGKGSLVMSLLELAKEEATNPTQFKFTKQVLGDVLEAVKPSSATRATWTDDSLEASHIENACERYIKGQRIQNIHTFVRTQGAANSQVIRRLLRPFQEEFDAILRSLLSSSPEDAAVADELRDLITRNSPMEVVSAFASYMVAFIQMSHSADLTSKTNVHEKLIDSGALHLGVEEGSFELLQSWIAMNPSIVADAAQRAEIWGELPARNWGEDEPVSELAAQRRFAESSCAKIELDAVPPWILDLGTQFYRWEAVVRNDIPELRSAPQAIFFIMLQCATNIKVMRMIHPDGDVPVSEGIPKAYRHALNVALEAHLGSPEGARDVVSKLMAFTQMTDLAPRGSLAPVGLFEAVLVQMQAMTTDRRDADIAAVLPLYVGVSIREIRAVANRSQRCIGTYSLLQRLTEDLWFHFRFAEVYRRLNAMDRKYIRTKQNVHMIKTVSYFEREFHIRPISQRATCLLSTVLLYMCTRSTGSQTPLVERLASCTHLEELGVIVLAGSEGVRIGDLKTALPPQLTYRSWLERGGESGELSPYKFMRGDAVKGTMNSIMLSSQSPIIKALDAISRVPWRISRYMLFVQEAIVREGYGFGKIRPAFYPLHYTAMKTGEIENKRLGRTLINMPMSRAYIAQRDKDWHNLSDLRSTRIHYLQALRQARSLYHHAAIYFPNSLDFRGRMYPLPGRLNHTGSDPFRAMLEHAEAKPLGAEGVFWLKVHLANKMGETKLTFEERAQYVDEHIKDVIESAESPLHGDKWWQDAAEPLQALMACRELASALKHSQGAEKFESRLAVAVDGSYNGLQHYSAIGRDEFGGKLVNLVPCERPADAYTGILKVMLKAIEADAANDVEVAQKCLGSGKGMDKNHIKRKTIKRPIMTQVYGVTHYGMQEQIVEELEKQNAAHGLWTQNDMKEMAAYLRDKLLESLGTIFAETQNCRKWLNDTATLIWKCQPNDLKGAFTWTTPLGLIVRQPYRVKQEGHLFSPHGYSRLVGGSHAPASRKQLSALAPNIIHSLDATHLAMTAIEMKNLGLSMMAVHDSYWTYASDLPILSRVLREQFVHLYENYDPLTELKQQWEEVFFLDLRRHGVKLPDPPKRGTLDLRQVLQSRYFFS